VRVAGSTEAAGVATMNSWPIRWASVIASKTVVAVRPLAAVRKVSDGGAMLATGAGLAEAGTTSTPASREAATGASSRREAITTPGT
jgi:hypothetical protein